MHTQLSADNELEVPDQPPSLALTAERTAPASQDILSPALASLSATPAWSDWRWQMRNRIRSLSQLKSFFPQLEPTTDLFDALQTFQMAISPYYAALIQQLNTADPIFSMSVPRAQELQNPAFLNADPLEEDHDMPVPGLVHRYHDRALLVATSACAMYCRHCTRKRLTCAKETTISASRLAQVTDYLRAHPEIHDVIISGGDPLTLPTATLETILRAVRSVPSVDIIRIGTRVPVTLPMRVTDELVAMLRQFHPLWINTHFNHPCELTAEAGAACARLVDAGIPLGNQTVLLKGINDDPRVMETLCRGLVKRRVRPYYLFQCDLVPGVEHFRTPLTRGIEIMEYLRGRLSGLAIPTFVVDAPGGGGKIPILPNYIVSMSPTHTVLRNFEGMLVSYPEPSQGPAAPRPTPAQPAPAVKGVWALTNGSSTKLVPSDTARIRRRTRKSVAVPVADVAL
jgi:lysine 2,3-aminomutase